MSPLANTIDQRRASHALNRHRQHQQYGDWKAEKKFWADYASTANGLPPAIRTSGLILALATEVARATSRPEDGRIAVLADLATWLIEWSRRHDAAWFHGLDEMPPPAPSPEVRTKILAAVPPFVARIIEADLRAYRLLEQETLAHLAWLKTLAKPLVPPKTSPTDQGDAPPAEPDAAAGSQ